MNCQELSFKICNLIEDYNEYEYKIQQIIQREREASDQSWIITEQELEHSNEVKVQEINTLLNNLYKKAPNESFNFYDTPLSVYKNCININLKTYLFSYQDALEIDFYEEELSQLNEPEEYRILKDKTGTSHYYHKLLNNKRNFDISLKRKIELIESKIQKLGYQIEDKNIIKKEFNNSIINYTFLNDFIKITSNSNGVKEAPFISLYNNEILTIKTLLKNEISENLLILDSINKKIYLDLIVSKIKIHPFSKFDFKILNNWLKEYNEQIGDFPNFNNSKLYIDLNSFYELSKYNSKESKKVLELQKEFFKYAAHLSNNEILNFMNQYTKNEEQQSVKPHTLDYNKNIFQSLEAEDWFNNTLEELGAIDEDKRKGTGLQAKANAIFRNKNCKENIFKYNLYLKTYIEFLNIEYQADIKSDSRLSDGNSYIDKIEGIINSYLNL
jgi:hypothetical protein